MGKEESEFSLIPEPVRNTNCCFGKHLTSYYGKWSKITGNLYAYFK